MGIDKDEQALRFFESYLTSVDSDDQSEVFTEERIVDEDNIRISVQSETARDSTIPYFYASIKISNYRYAIRLHYRDPGYEKHRNSENAKPWEFTRRDAKDIQALLADQSPRYPSHTNWEYACFLWNKLNDAMVSVSENNKHEVFDNYCRGMYDFEFRNCKQYLPSYQPMPPLWE